MRLTWRFFVFVVGWAVLLTGVAMIVLPGPAVVVIPLGLAILGSEFAWAHQLLHRLRERGGRWAERLRHHQRRARASGS